MKQSKRALSMLLADLLSVGTDDAIRTSGETEDDLDVSKLFVI